MRITIEDTDDDGQIGEKWVVEGDFTDIGDLFEALKRLTLGIGHAPENVENYFGDCENWTNKPEGLGLVDEQKWIKMWKHHEKKQKNN